MLSLIDISVLTTVVRFTWLLTVLTSSSALSVMVDGELAVALFLQGVVFWGEACRFLGDDIGLEFLTGEDVPASVKSDVIFDASNRAYKIWIINTSWNNKIVVSTCVCTEKITSFSY